MLLEDTAGKSYLGKDHPDKFLLLSKRLSIESGNAGKKSMPDMLSRESTETTNV
jgi:hypothetical protein